MREGTDRGEGQGTDDDLLGPGQGWKIAAQQGSGCAHQGCADPWPFLPMLSEISSIKSLTTRSQAKKLHSCGTHAVSARGENLSHFSFQIMAKYETKLETSFANHSRAEDADSKIDADVIND